MFHGIIFNTHTLRLDDLHAKTNERLSSTVQRTAGKKRGWMRKRFLSFMGVVGEDDDNEHTLHDDERRYSLTCSMCHVENPTIPYIASCGHCYCYLCLCTAVTDDLSFRCVDCGEWIVSSGRSTLGRRKATSA